MACSWEAPHMAGEGAKLAQTAGRCGWPKIRQPLAASSCTQRTPAGFPCGMPGIALEIEGATQQAPQPERQFMGFAIKSVAASAQWIRANALIVA